MSIQAIRNENKGFIPEIFHTQNFLNFSKKVQKLALCIFVIYTLANIPTASADGKAYMDCVEKCVNGNSSPWAHLLCGIICSPLIVV